MPAPQASANTSSGQTLRKNFVSHRASLRPVYTHGTPSATPYSASLLLPCNASGTELAPGCPSRQICETSALTEDFTAALALSPNGIHAAHALRSGRVNLVHLPTGRSRTIIPASDQGVVSLIAFDASGEYVALATADGNVRVYGVENCNPTHVYQGATGGAMLTAVAFHPIPDEAALLIASEDGVVRKCDLRKSRLPPKELSSKHVSSVVSIAFADAGKIVVTGGADKLMCFANWPQMNKPKLISVGERIVSIVRPGDDDSHAVLSVGELGVIRKWDARTGREDVGHGLELPFVTGSRNGDDSMEGKNAGDEEDGDEIQTPVQPTSMTLCGENELVVAMSDYSLLYVGVSDGAVPTNVRKVVCGNLEEIYDIRVLPECKGSGKVSSVARKDFAIASNSSLVWIMRFAASAQATEDDGSRMQFEGDGNQDREETGIWSCHAGLSGHTGIVLCVDALTKPKAIGKDTLADSYIATSSRDKTARVWRRSRSSGLWTCMATAEGHTSTVGTVAISPKTAQGQFFIVTGAADRTIKRWNLDQAHLSAEERERAEMEPTKDEAKRSQPASCLEQDETGAVLSAMWTTLAHSKDVNAVSISPNGGIIASGSQDRLVKLWDAANGSLKCICEGHRRGVWNVAFSDVDRIVASGSADATIRIWNVATGNCLRTLQGHVSGVLRCTFISSGTQIASSGADGLVKIWGTRSGECVTTIDGHEDRAWALDKVDDGDILVSGGADGLARMWRDATEEEALAEVEKREEDALMEQEVQNAARAGKWIVAARGALRLGMSQKLRSIVIDLIATEEEPGKELIRMVSGLREGSEGESDKECWALLTKLFLCCRDWNATGGAKNGAIASYVLQALFSTWTPDTLCESLSVDKRGLVEALDAHCCRHLERVSQFSGQIAILDHTLQQMRGLGNVDDPVRPAEQGPKRKAKASSGDNGGTATKTAKRKRKRREDFPSEY